MYIITNKDDVLINFSNTLEYDSIGNYIIKDKTLILLRAEGMVVYSDIVVPDNITEDGKWCYTEKDGFTLNPDYVEPGKTVEQQLSELTLKLEMAQEAVDFLLMQ